MYNKNILVEEFQKPLKIDKKGNIIREHEIIYEIDDELLNEAIKKNVNVKPKDGETYKEFFKRAMKEYGIDNITDMTDEEKDKFFTSIENLWTKENPKTDDKDKRNE